MPSGKPGHGSKRPTDAQPQNEILRSWGLGGNPQQAAPEAEWLSRGIACYSYPEFGITIVIPKVGLSRNLIFQPVSMLISFKKFGITFPPF